MYAYRVLRTPYNTVHLLLRSTPYTILNARRDSEDSESFGDCRHWTCPGQARPGTKWINRFTESVGLPVLRSVLYHTCDSEKRREAGEGKGRGRERGEGEVMLYCICTSRNAPPSLSNSTQSTPE